MSTGADSDEDRGASSFEAFFSAEHAGLFGALYLIAGNRQEAEELMQEAFLKVWERWDRVRAMQDPTGYLYRTAMNEFRMRRRQAVVAARRALGRIPGPNAFDAVDARDALDRALASISSRQRAAIVLTDLLWLFVRRGRTDAPDKANDRSGARFAGPPGYPSRPRGWQ